MALGMKPCPFCGSEKQRVDKWLIERINDKHMEFAVLCENCGAIGPNDMGRSGAIEMWNLRRPMSSLIAENDELHGMVAQLEDKLEETQIESQRQKEENEKTIKSFRSWKASIDEALNSGDGVYRP